MTKEESRAEVDRALDALLAEIDDALQDGTDLSLDMKLRIRSEIARRVHVLTRKATEYGMAISIHAIREAT